MRYCCSGRKFACQAKRVEFNSHIPLLMKTKVCSKCNIELEISQFHKAKHHTDGLQSRCKRCQKEYHREHYLNNRTKYISKAAAYIKKARTVFYGLKDKLECKNCGEKDIACLDFHHRDS